MKLKSLFLFLLIAPSLIFLSQGCDKCKESGTVTFDGATQYFQVTYLVDSNGVNYADSIWNPNRVHVLFSANGKTGPFGALSEDLTDGKIGPFPYTTGPVAAKKGIFHDYMYIVTKDTFGIDTFELKFYPAVDECHEYWGTLEYYRNGQMISTCTDLEACSLEIRE
jgi:hypothetical protein